ncbi:DNA-processing protein DprA [uncultured Bacteroides sp.]|uniref:DNA-processing protein DprA n=1 Tax=uncultured Bacteroides sp. TaxID=162156 RepID=UPI0025D73F70|nr:DNA-processing protein DprA [uncultured Bacteroides sp.]
MVEFLGNKELLNRSKTAFLCSRNVSSASVLRCYDWATEMKKKNQVIVSGFQSKIEKDVLHFLLKSHQPVIIVIARQMYKQLPEEWHSPMNNDTLLVVSVAPKAIRTSAKAAYYRNRYITSIADTIVFGFISEGSSLQLLYDCNRQKSIILTE